MRHLDIRFILAAFCLTAFCAGGCENAAGTATPAPRTEDGPQAVPTVTVARADLTRTTTQPATVHPDHEARIYAKVSGYLKELRVDIGQRVEQRDVLAIIDVPEMILQLERQQQVMKRLEAEQLRAMAEVELARARLTATEAAREQAQADVQKADAQLAADQAEFNRVKDLVESRALEGRLLDESQARLDAAKAARSAALAALASADANVQVDQARVAAAEADQTVAQAETEVANKQLEELDELVHYSILTAPFDGVVVQRSVEMGDLVRNTQTSGDIREPLFTIAKLDKVRIRIAVPEDDAPWTDPGDPVAVRLTALAHQPIQGEVTRVARALDRSTRTMLVELDVPNPDLRLLPGLYGEATISLEAVDGALVLPSGAVRYRESGESYVYTVSDAKTIQVVPVESGLDDGRQMQITAGLSEGDRVVGAMIGRLEEGQSVQVQ